MELSPLTKYLTYQLYHAVHLMHNITSEEDTADLHQFRIVIRRIRSLLKLYFKDSTLFPPLLKNSVKQTNVLRELDVLFSAIKPKSYPQTFKYLTTLRQEQFRSIFTDTFKYEVITALHRYSADLSGIKQHPPSTQWLNIADEHYRSCVNDYTQLSTDATQKELHALRIRFKTARYGFEFLKESALADEEVKISECKRYQDNLGALQDTFTQLSWLKKFYKEDPNKEVRDLIRKRKKKLKAFKRSKEPNRSA